jgi:uncharacterized membrane protein YkgB
MAGIGRLLILLGIVFLVVGVLLLAGTKIPWLGRLPGDIHVKRENFEFHFPLATCVLISLLLTGLLWLIGRFWRR